jgi:methionine aminopeptidase
MDGMTCVQVRTYCGHGIGDLFHCAPSIPHYAKNKAVGVMKVGHTFTIEPMINQVSHPTSPRASPSFTLIHR